MSEDVRTEDVVEAPPIDPENGEAGLVTTGVGGSDAGHGSADAEGGGGSADAEGGGGSADAEGDGGSADADAEDDGDSADAEDAGEADGGDADGSDNPLDTEGEIAADYLEELLDIADLDGDIDTYVDGDRAHVSVITDSDVLVGRDGEVLDALQELTRLAVMTETGERSRLMLDVGGFRDKRRTELLKLTADSVAEVKGSGERLKLSRMNPFERKIVHDAVGAAGLTSESEGEEPNRCVVIIP